MLTKHDDLIVTPCDKKLGPAIIKHENYIHMVLDKHLSDKGTYKSLTPD